LIAYNRFYEKNVIYKIKMLLKRRYLVKVLTYPKTLKIWIKILVKVLDLNQIKIIKNKNKRKKNKINRQKKSDNKLNLLILEGSLKKVQN
jgi:hypothetical protein